MARFLLFLVLGREALRRAAFAKIGLKIAFYDLVFPTGELRKIDRSIAPASKTL